MTTLSDKDREIIEAVTFDSTSSPLVELLSGMLVWSDEKASREVSEEGRNYIRRLLVSRAILHRELPAIGHRNYGELFKLREDAQILWEEAKRSGLKWNGFGRQISKEECELLDRTVAQAYSGETL